MQFKKAQQLKWAVRMYITPPTVVAKAPSEPEIGHGLGSTK